MGKGRLEAFSDGVIAIIITIMVLELKTPHEPTLDALVERAPTFLSYLLSFIYVGIYWGNHHHLLHTVRTVNAGVIWANMGLLFWLSLVPFVTAWVGETHAASLPTACYGVLLAICGVSYQILQTRIARQQVDVAGQTAHRASAVKGYFALACYLASVPIAMFWKPIVSVGLFTLVAAVWLVPDSRFEQVHASEG